MLSGDAPAPPFKTVLRTPQDEGYGLSVTIAREPVSQDSEELSSRDKAPNGTNVMVRFGCSSSCSAIT